MATRWERRLGHVVLTLKHGDRTSRTARPDWDDTYWKHWASIHRVWIGGGLVNGHLGACMIRSERGRACSRGRGV